MAASPAASFPGLVRRDFGNCHPSADDEHYFGAQRVVAVHSPASWPPLEAAGAFDAAPLKPSGTFTSSWRQSVPFA